MKSEEKYVKLHWKKTVKLKNGWLLSLGYEKEELGMYEWISDEDYITERQLSTSLKYMSEVVNTLGIPQINSYFYDDDGQYTIREVEYLVSEKTIRINMYE